MRNFLMAVAFILLACNANAQGVSNAIAEGQYVLVVHGGAGSISKDNISKEQEEQYKASLNKALKAGEEILRKGGKAVDAVQAAINILEDDSLFNAGKGAVYNNEGYATLDASIMDGSDLNAGAVAGVTNVKNPINAARLVMDKSAHVLLSGNGAEQFAEQNGCVIVDKEYFKTEKSSKAYEQALKNKGKKSQVKQPENIDGKYGTVGAVALDKKGNLAAGTSTGGMTNKKFGRIGDSPIIGAGTYADNVSCAVSCTGWGEYYIRLGLAKAVCDRVELQGLSIKEATKVMIHDKLDKMGASGGIIAVDRYGSISIDFNTIGMHRAWTSSAGNRGVELY